PILDLAAPDVDESVNRIREIVVGDSESHTPVEFFVIGQVVSCVVNHHHIRIRAEKDCFHRWPFFIWHLFFSPQRWASKCSLFSLGIIQRETAKKAFCSSVVQSANSRFRLLQSAAWYREIVRLACALSFLLVESNISFQ